MSRASSRAASKGEVLGADSTDGGAESAAIERAATITAALQDGGRGDGAVSARRPAPGDRPGLGERSTGRGPAPPPQGSRLAHLDPGTGGCGRDPAGRRGLMIRVPPSAAECRRQHCECVPPQLRRSGGTQSLGDRTCRPSSAALQTRGRVGDGGVSYRRGAETTRWPQRCDPLPRTRCRRAPDPAAARPRAPRNAHEVGQAHVLPGRDRAPGVELRGGEPQLSSNRFEAVWYGSAAGSCRECQVALRVSPG